MWTPGTATLPGPSSERRVQGREGWFQGTAEGGCEDERGRSSEVTQATHQNT